MKHLLRPFLVILFAWPMAASAADLLKEKEVQQFLTVAEAIEDFDERYPDVELDVMGESEGKNPAQAIGDMIDEKGRFKMFANMVEMLAKHPEARRDMEAEVKKAGFASMPEFASVGDRLMLAMARVEISDRDLREMEQAVQMVGAGGLDMLPPQARQMIAPMLKIAKAMENVPESDVALAKKYKPRFDALGS